MSRRAFIVNMLHDPEFSGLYRRMGLEMKSISVIVAEQIIRESHEEKRNAG